MDPALRRSACEAWAFRHRVEVEAALRFDRLAERLRQLDVPADLVAHARSAAEDERRHAELCRALTVQYGSAPAEPPLQAPEVAPRRLALRDAVLYEVVAACCITETESVGVVTTLLAVQATPQVLAALRQIARDEVAHSRLGWAYLTYEQARGEVAFLSPLIPQMLEGTAGPALFQPAPADEPAAERLAEHGVLSRQAKRETFLAALEQVILPGLERSGVDPAPAHAWLARKRSV